MKRSKFDIDYLKWLRQIDVEEDDSVWEEIQNELDFDETWDYINRELDRIKPQRRRIVKLPYPKIISAAAAVIFIILALTFFLNQKTNHPTIPSDRNLTSETFVDKESNIASGVNQEVDIPRISQYQSPEPDSASESRQEEKPVFSAKNESALPETKEDRETIEGAEAEGAEGAEGAEATGAAGADERDRIQNIQFEAEKLAVIDLNDVSALIAPQNINIAEPVKTSGSFLDVVDIGLVYGYKNTWLLNYETINGLNPKKLGNSLPTFHQEMGVLSTLAFKKNHRIGIEFLWRSETGQNYQQYINANYVHRNITLNYLKLQAFYIREHKKIPGMTIVGGYIAGLNMAQEIQGNDMFNINGNYRNLDYGLLIGHQFNIPIIDKLTIRPGFRFNYSFINIFKGDAIVPATLNTPYFAAGLNIAVSYRFLQ